MEHNYPRVAGRATLFALALLVAGLIWWLFWPAGDSEHVPPQATVAGQVEPLQLVTSSGTHDLKVERATTPEAQALGLMYRTELADDRGMLFVHDAPREIVMWMKNTYIPLDMIFLKSDGSVHRIAHKTEPHSETMIPSNGPVSAVLEIPGGAARRYGLKPGDKVRHAFFNGG